MPSRRSVCLALATLLAPSVKAQGNSGWLPNRPIRFIAPYAPGAAADMVSRIIAHQLTQALGQNVYVDNKPGAGGVLGMTELSRSPADGHTLALGATSNVSISPVVFKKVPYDVAKDFRAIARVAIAPMLVVAGPKSEVRNLAELIERSTAKPGSVFCASSGNGTLSHMAVAMVNHRYQAQFTHVPYQSEAAALTGLMSGDIQVYIGTAAAAVPLVQSGKLKALGVPAPQRNPQLPEVPTLQEQGLGDLVVDFWYGVLAPKATPDAVVSVLQDVIVKSFEDPEGAAALRKGGLIPATQRADTFAKQIDMEIERYGSLVRSIGLQLD